MQMLHTGYARRMGIMLSLMVGYDPSTELFCDEKTLDINSNFLIIKVQFQRAFGSWLLSKRAQFYPASLNVRSFRGTDFGGVVDSKEGRVEKQDKSLKSVACRPRS